MPSGRRSGKMVVEGIGTLLVGEGVGTLNSRPYSKIGDFGGSGGSGGRGAEVRY